MKKIAILVKEGENINKIKGYYMGSLIAHWIDDGYSVEIIVGTKKYIPADILILHVNLSVVPDEYIKFSESYPLVINGKIKDIRKSTFSQNLLTKSSSYNGPVIVKTDLNYFGKPEKTTKKTLFEKLFGGLKNKPDFEYIVYDTIDQVPEDIFENPELIVEKFLPEREGEHYCLRNYVFLGDQEMWIKLYSNEQIIKAKNTIRFEIIEPEPELVEMRKRLQIDYGKMDYVIYNNKPILLDVNKTIGQGRKKQSRYTNVRQSTLNSKEFSKGLYYYE